MRAFSAQRADPRKVKLVMELWWFGVGAIHGPSCGGLRAGLATLVCFRCFTTSSPLPFSNYHQNKTSVTAKELASIK